MQRIIFICVTAVFVSLSGVYQTGSLASPLYWAGHKTELEGQNLFRVSITYALDGKTFQAQIDWRFDYSESECSGLIKNNGDLNPHHSSETQDLFANANSMRSFCSLSSGI